ETEVVGQAVGATVIEAKASVGGIGEIAPASPILNPIRVIEAPAELVPERVAHGQKVEVIAGVKLAGLGRIVQPGIVGERLELAIIQVPFVVEIRQLALEVELGHLGGATSG